MSQNNESIVLVGGGGGVYRVARFLKHLRRNITTVQTVFDHGGHSGILRDERGSLPPGDIRQAILALADDNLEPTLRKLLAFRFGKKGSSSLNGATVGNLLLTALTEIEGSLPLAVTALSRLCRVQGRVLPVSLDDAELCVRLSDDSILKGEGHIDTRSIEDHRTIEEAFLEPEAQIYSRTHDALVTADKIVLCPGDIFTSLVPNLLVGGFKEALQQSKAKLIYCVNLMTKKSETEGFDVYKSVKVVHKYAGKKIDYVIFNTEEIDPEIVAHYAKEKAVPIRPGKEDKNLASSWIGADLVGETGGIVRHNQRIAAIIADL